MSKAYTLCNNEMNHVITYQLWPMYYSGVDVNGWRVRGLAGARQYMETVVSI